MMSNTLMLMKNRIQTSTSALRRRVAALAGGNSGGLLIEVIIAVFVFTLVGTAILSGISTTQISGARVENQSIAENIARNEAEYVMTLAYIPPGGPDYAISPALLPLPQGYTLSATPTTLNVTGLTTDPNTIEVVVVTISYGGNPVLVLESVKTSG
ncbi:MAG: hypothetical protein IIC22_00220 [Chloroflexi bacterium]|nr:hypothetical protein [Chloroflexota bacterium]